jgi:hypothetical protein
MFMVKTFKQQRIEAELNKKIREGLIKEQTTE